ncbi:DUF7860 family protein [Halosegnis longus]|uniref:Uncharacterized protein n=1 Tax=Halosegnis longus TaxID=2216012 RepID=A0AAJ4RAP8_9EURY|nr:MULTISPECIES: hypothetical protein [Halobacteriales]RNJ27302.1 hypothetical protein Nmn1133_11845 [Salella cibi]
MSHTGTTDYATVTKRATALGFTLFALGAGIELLTHAAGITLPAWEHTLLVDMEILGILIFAISPFLFGIALPLVE